MATLLKTKVRHGDTLHVFMGEQADSGELAAWLDNLRDSLVVGGDALQFEDGSREWLEDVAMVNHDEFGSKQYTWDRSGNKVKCVRLRCRAVADGTVTKDFLRYVWRFFDAV